MPSVERKCPLRWRSRLAAVALCQLLLALAQGQDRTVLDNTKIIGNRELPKVLYIVPWKKPLADPIGDASYPSVLDEALQPLDPRQFELSISYAGAPVRRVGASVAAPAASSPHAVPGQSRP